MYVRDRSDVEDEKARQSCADRGNPGSAVSRAGVRSRHAHSSTGVALGIVLGEKCGTDGTRSEEAFSSQRMGEAAFADDLLRPRVLPRAQSRFRRVPDLFVGGGEACAGLTGSG